MVCQCDKIANLTDINKHCLFRHRCPLDACFTCASHEARAAFLRESKDAESEQAVLEQYCKENNLFKAPAASDGHCLFNAFQIASAGIYNADELKVMVHNEIVLNPTAYDSFILETDKEHLENELTGYLDGGLFNNNVGDLCVYALASVTSTKIEVLQIDDGKVNRLTLTPRSGTFHSTVMLARTLTKTQPHFDALIPDHSIRCDKEIPSSSVHESLSATADTAK